MKLPNCKDTGDGQPCGNYPARTADECTFSNMKTPLRDVQVSVEAY